MREGELNESRPSPLPFYALGYSQREREVLSLFTLWEK